jgi:iron complex outermembrane receptor protein
MQLAAREREQHRRQIISSALVLAALALLSRTAQAQRSSEDAVAEALDAFGTGVGRETIGLYSAGNARGFSPIQAGNLRIEGLYFDTVSGFPFSFLPSRVVRGYAVHVGVAAQGYLLPAPTGVVDYQLRTPGNEPLASVLVGYATYGVAYAETDAQLPLIRDVLSIGGGVGYTRNAIYSGAGNSDDWTFGWTARWQPTENLEITPFWDFVDHREYGEKATVFLDQSGYPRYYSVQLAAVPWTGIKLLATQFGTIARLHFGDGWQLAAGVFRSVQNVIGDFTLLENVGSHGVGDFSVTALPQQSSGSTSGEIRLSKLLHTGPVLNTFYLRMTGRDSSIEAAPGDTIDLGKASLTQVPLGHELQFDLGPITDVKVHQWTPGLAYKGVWPQHAELTMGLQKVGYQRNVMAPGVATVSDHSSPWLYSAAATVSLTPKLLAYGSFTQGFEEIGTAPFNALNRNEPVPAQQTRQVDVGVRYQLAPKLQLVAGAFEIEKPYFNIDLGNVFRELGSTSNRGIELSVAGDLTEHLNVVSGLVLIEPTVHYRPGTVAGPTNAIAVGPVPGTITTAIEYHPAAISGLILGATLQALSSRYAVYPEVDLPAVATIGVDARYRMRVLGKDATVWLQGYNLADTYGLYANPSSMIQAFDARRVELSFVIDL